MKEQSEPLAPGVILRDDDHRMFVYLGEFKGQPMAAPLRQRDKQVFAADVPLTDGVTARVSAIAPVAQAAPTGQTLDPRQLAACMQALKHLADTENLIARHVLDDTDGALFSRSSFQKAPTGGGSMQPGVQKPGEGEV